MTAVMAFTRGTSVGCLALKWRQVRFDGSLGPRKTQHRAFSIALRKLFVVFSVSAEMVVLTALQYVLDSPTR